VDFRGVAAHAVAHPLARRDSAGQREQGDGLECRFRRDLLHQRDDRRRRGRAQDDAGEGNARRWIQAFGDPRSPATDPIDWIEEIPFGETRNYVQRVIENLQVYRNRVAGRDQPLRIMADLYAPGTPPTKVLNYTPPPPAPPTPVALPKPKPAEAAAGSR